MLEVSVDAPMPTCWQETGYYTITRLRIRELDNGCYPIVIQRNPKQRNLRGVYNSRLFNFDVDFTTYSVWFTRSHHLWERVHKCRRNRHYNALLVVQGDKWNIL